MGANNVPPSLILKIAEEVRRRGEIADEASERAPAESAQPITSPKPGLRTVEDVLEAGPTNA